MCCFERKYGVATAAGTHVRVPMIKAGSADFAGSGDWTPAAGDVKLSKDGGSEANITSLPTFVAGRWQYEFSAAELQCKQLDVNIIDSATKEVEDNAFTIVTFGHPLALKPFDGMQIGVGIMGTVTGTPSTTSIQLTGDDLSSTDDFYNKQFLVIAGITRQISNYIGSTKTCEFEGSAGELNGPWPAAPSSGDVAFILGLGP